MNNAKRKEILTRLRDANPHPTTELNFSTPFELLVAVTLSAQSTDVGVNKATDKLFPVANTPQAIADLGVEGLTQYIKTIGLYNAKAKNVHRLSEILVEKYNSEVPESREALEALPGVGRKTANVVLNTAFGWPTIAVDTHIYRVSNRTKLAMGKTVEKVEEKLLKVVPAEFKVDVHHWLILHGRYTCIARKPRCGSCIIEDLCEFKDKLE
ncbi:endonuclease III [Alteromonas sp. A079]|uniref:endonuclease III n=1 Tax=Alteromonas sp. A079 TaxID=3410268 RepID=UPI003BA24434